MIPLEKQVCSLDLAKRLKELGVKQESLFYWCKLNQEELKLSSSEYADEWGAGKAFRSIYRNL